MSSPHHEITELLRAHAAGDEAALRRVFALVYPELRRSARRRILSSRRGQTLNTTGLVHEAYVKLAEGARVSWKDRQHFFAVAARVMRQIVVDGARERLTARRGRGRSPEPLRDVAAGTPLTMEELVDLDVALERLAAVDTRLTRVVECRYFAGYTEQETADALDVSLRTVQREWKLARGWLRTALSR